MAPRKLKLTQELVDSWLELAWRDGYRKGGDSDDTLPIFKDLLPKELPSDFASQSQLPFNPSKCEARILKDGYGIQCSRSPFGGGCLCKTHQDKFDSLADGLDIPFGRYNKERPTHSLDRPDGGNKIAWYDTKQARAPRSSKTPNMKVGELRDYLSTRIPNENFKGMKKAELKELYEKEKAKELQSDSDEEKPGENVENPIKEKPEEKVEDPVEEKPEEKVKNPVEEKSEDPVEEKHEDPVEEKPEEKREEEVEKSSIDSTNAIDEAKKNCGDRLEKLEEKENSDVSEKVSSGVGTLVDTIPRTKPEYVKLFEKLGIDANGLSGLRAYKQRYEEYLKEKEEETEDMSDEDVGDDLQEDKSSFQKIDFEGVEYLEDEDTAELYNTAYKKVGKWNDDCDDIIWESPAFKEEHENKSC